MAYTLDSFASLAIIGKLFGVVANKIRRRKDARGLFLGAPKRKPGPGDSPSHFLQEQYEIVPFMGRDGELERLRNWATKKEPRLSIALLTGRPGSGKSRLARQLSREVQKTWNDSWFAGALNVESLPGDRSLEPPYFTPLLGALKGPILLSVDYAERQLGLVRALIRAAQAAADQRGKRQTRLLLVARTKGDWLGQLKNKFRNELDNPLEESRRLEIELSPLKVDDKDVMAEFTRARAVFSKALKGRMTGGSSRWRRARAAFCKALKGDAKGGTDTPPSQDGLAPLLTPGYKPEVLDIHIAALLAAYGTPLPKMDGASDETPERSLLDALLRREKEAWWEALKGKVPDSTAADRAAVWLGVTGPVKDEDGAFTRLSSLPDLEGKEKGEQRAIARALKGLHPDVGEAWLGGLRPDRLATFATEVLEEADLRQAVPALQPEALAQLLTHLAWYWQRYPGQREKGEARLRAALTAAGANMVRTVLSVAPAVDEPIVRIATEQLNAALQEDQAAMFVNVCRDCVDSLPENTVVLREFAAAITEVTYRNATDPIEEAASANKFSTRLSDLGRHQEALKASQESIEIRRPLAKKNPDAFRSDLAMSLNNLSNRLGDLGRHEKALDAIREAVGIYRPLAEQNPDAFCTYLARSLNNLSNRLSELGRHTEAHGAIQEVVDIYRPLAEQNPDAFCPDLAMSLNNLSHMLSALGQHEEALKVINEAVGIYRPLAEQNPDAFCPDLAMSLNNLSKWLSDLGQHEEALEAIQEAIEIRRPLAKKNPDAFQPKLADSLNNLSNMLSALGQHGKALDAIQEVVGIYRPLAEQNPDAFRSNVAMSLNNLSNRLNDLGQYEEALEAIQEAAGIYRPLAEQNPDAFRPDLATSLNNLSNRLSTLGRHQEALKAIQEAIEIRRLLAEQNPDAFRPDLAESLNNLSNRLSTLGRHQEALKAINEAIEIRRPLAEQNPDAFRPNLVKSLNNLSGDLSALGQHEEALKASQEAIEISRLLAKQNPGAFHLYLAGGLNNLSNRLSDLGRHEEALDAIQEAVGIYRPLVEQNPDAFRSDLAMSLNNLNNRLSDLGRHEEALKASQEAAGIYRPLTKKNPDDFRPDD